MSRLERLRAIRRIELDIGLRGLAVAEARLGQLAAMRERLAGLANGLPADPAPLSWKAATASRERLGLAGVQVAVALDGAQSQRDAAATAAARLRVRVDVVETALAAQR